jgi:hypothetical protein
MIGTDTSSSKTRHRVMHPGWLVVFMSILGVLAFGLTYYIWGTEAPQRPAVTPAYSTTKISGTGPAMSDDGIWALIRSLDGEKVQGTRIVSRTDQTGTTTHLAASRPMTTDDLAEYRRKATEAGFVIETVEREFGGDLGFRRR